MKSVKHLSGVTLLEIILILLIAALLVTISVRYYHLTQVNVATRQIEKAIGVMMVYAENVGVSADGYTGLTANDLWNTIPSDIKSPIALKIKTQWGDATIDNVSSDEDKYTVSIALPENAPDSLCEQGAAFASGIAKQHEGSSAVCNAGKIQWTVYLKSRRIERNPHE